MADNFGLKIGVEGEKEFKKALADINSSFKVLGSEMTLVSSQFDKNDRSVASLTAKNSVLTKEIEQQKSKIELLRSALANASESFGENDKRTQSWQVQLNKAQAELNGMERELDENERALDGLGDEFDDSRKDADKFGDEVKKTGETSETAGEKFKKFGAVVKDIGAALGATLAAIGTATVAAGKKLFELAQQTADAGDEIDKTSQKLGMSAETYQKWDYVLGQSGVEITSMTTGLKTLTNQIDDAKNGSDKAAERFDDPCHT